MIKSIVTLQKLTIVFYKAEWLQLLCQVTSNLKVVLTGAPHFNCESHLNFTVVD